MLRGWVFKGQGLRFTAHGPREIEPKPACVRSRPVFWTPLRALFALPRAPCIPDRGARIAQTGSMVTDRAPRIPDHGARIDGHGSRRP